MFPDYDPLIGKARAVRHGPRRRRCCVLPRNTPQVPPPAVALQFLRARLLLSLQPLKLLWSESVRQCNRAWPLSSQGSDRSYGPAIGGDIAYRTNLYLNRAPSV